MIRRSPLLKKLIELRLFKYCHFPGMTEVNFHGSLSAFFTYRNATRLLFKEFNKKVVNPSWIYTPDGFEEENSTTFA